MSYNISVIIPTYNKSELLIKTLESISMQSIGKDRFEVIVVDDGSSDNTFSVVRSYEPHMNISYAYQPDKGFRVAMARNRGIQLSNSPVLLFLDSGMIASVNLLESHLSKHKTLKSAVVLGLSYGVEEYSNDNTWRIDDYLEKYSIEDVFNHLKTDTFVRDCRHLHIEAIGFDLEKSAAPWLICWSGHFSAPTYLLKKVQGFDEKFVSWGGEDVELGLRLFISGGRFCMLKDYYTIHLPHEKDSHSRKASALKNIEYIQKKHKGRIAPNISLSDWTTAFN